MTKVFIIQSSLQYSQMFLDYGFEIVSSIREADLVCFTGGSDVSPHLYGEGKHPCTGNIEARDVAERELFLRAVEMDIPMVGICRGGQFLNVMNGGKMYQHVERHTHPHNIFDVETKEIIYSSSTHHQMMRPAENGIIIATANLGGWKEYMSEIYGYWGVNRVTDDDVDVEVVYYPHTSCLCFQPHPEFVSYVQLRDYFFSVINRFIKFKETV